MRFALFLIEFLLFISNYSYSQVSNPFIYTCQVNGYNQHNGLTIPTFGGYLKPERTDYNGVPSDAYFPVLIVFVQFVNEPYPNLDYWSAGSPPTYLNTIIAQSKKTPSNGDWWDTYSETTELLSDFWMEQSRGHFHVVGKAYSIILDHDYQYYQNIGGIHRINDEIYQKLCALGTIDWREFDRWKVVNDASGYYFAYQPDGYVDMIYKVHRTHAPLLGMPSGGNASLDYSETQGDNFLIDTLHQIYINGGTTSQLASGITLTPGYMGTEGENNYASYSPLDRTGMVSFSEHEHGHYLFGCSHMNYGKMSGSGAPYGVDEELSPWETIKMGYMQPIAVNYNNPNYLLNDFSSRDNNINGQVLQVPVNGTDEFFLIANRRKVSLYDKIMWGDTAHGSPYREINPEYGKGIYIYHTPGGYAYPSDIDQECADGLYTWIQQGYQYPDWSNTQLVEYYVRTAISYDNDRSKGNLQSADGKSAYSWFNIGRKNSDLNTDGTDRMYTNHDEIWTSRDQLGDRWDPWNIGYNEIFSPYSSPSTKDWNNNYSGIFIWYDSLDAGTNTAKLKIYKAGQGGFTESSILALTPPSRPMGLQVQLTTCANNISYPKLTWKHNQEPDMLRGGSVKRYRIYRTKTVDSSVIPTDYAIVNTADLNSLSDPVFIDYNYPISCTGSDATINVFNLRYQVTAIDNTNWESVKSDFASLSYSSIVTGNQNEKNKIPESFLLYQNYPNPFNPSTEIKFDLPCSGNVTIKVYNLLGGLVSMAVNEFKTAGTYSISFNGTNLASGIYIYRIEVPGFTDSKRMVLVK